MLSIFISLLGKENVAGKIRLGKKKAFWEKIQGYIFCHIFVQKGQEGNKNYTNIRKEITLVLNFIIVDIENLGKKL